MTVTSPIVAFPYPLPRASIDTIFEHDNPGFVPMKNLHDNTIMAQNPFIAKSQTAQGYIQPTHVFMVQHLIEDRDGPGPASHRNGSRTYPDCVGVFIDHGLAKTAARELAKERMRLLGHNEDSHEWGSQMLIHAINGHDRSHAGEGYILRGNIGSSDVVETIWVQVGAWNMNIPGIIRQK